MLRTEASIVEHARTRAVAQLPGVESEQIRHAVSARDAIKLSSSVILKRRLCAGVCDGGSVVEGVE